MSNDLDSLLKKLEEERKKTFTSLQKEVESWKENYEKLLKSIENSLEEGYKRINQKLQNIDNLAESKLDKVEEDAQKQVQELIEKKKKIWIAVIRRPIVDLERELQSMEVIKPILKTTLKALKLTILTAVPLGLIAGGVVGGIAGWTSGKKLGEKMGREKYQKKLAEVEKLEKNYKLLKPEWVKKWKIETIYAKQGSFPCLVSRTALEKMTTEKIWTLLPEGISEDTIPIDEEVEKYCIPLDPRYQHHIEP